MCEFLSFKIERSLDGLKIVTAPSLDSHDEIPGDGNEGEWTDDGELEIRVAPDVSENVKSELEAFVRKTYRTQQNMANLLIVKYLKQGVMPVHFYQHSRLDDCKLRLFACDCAELVLPIFEKQYPDEQRPRNAVNVARKFANGEATSEELAAAWAAAWAAAGSAAWSAAGSAAWSAAGSAAQAAAWAAAWSAAGSAAWSAAEKWQAAQLLKYINEK